MASGRPAALAHEGRAPGGLGATGGELAAFTLLGVSPYDTDAAGGRRTGGSEGATRAASASGRTTSTLRTALGTPNGASAGVGRGAIVDPADGADGADGVGGAADGAGCAAKEVGALPCPPSVKLGVEPAPEALAQDGVRARSGAANDPAAAGVTGAATGGTPPRPTGGVGAVPGA